MPDRPAQHPRRLRANPAIRDMLVETHLTRDQLIAPLFVCAEDGTRAEVRSMPGQFRLGVPEAMETLRRWVDAGLRSVLLFGVPGSKDARGSAAWDENEAVQRLSREIRRNLPAVNVFTDTCLCEYTDHGHCGPLVTLPDGSVTVDNEAALEGLAKTAVSQARAGAQFVAPSAMMDGQVAAIRSALDAEGFDQTGILSYAVKFASSLYGPFRDAAGSAPSCGDRRSYQMDYRSPRQASMEARLDEAEGADMLMVKPAAAYLDVIAQVRRQSDLPLAAYHVSGEYAMIKAAAANGWLDERDAALEVTLAIRRAGADAVITYFAEQLAEWLQ